ncbi:helix-turn-helix domain-containing protein [Xenorhabdus nematophila]|uniref:NadS family protein n=2 Tax=Xenorhabdus nematophila TaxID=628 RepID=UPI00054386B9|nr:NadS family protein [Xenorhabdus nematophila]CEF31300.1 putative transcriptional regulator [Xenorhabdus nematophila str. Websteri]AYA40050.1 helix-turn-helix domain-containing protein [Xenorhabdus nematophila]MBA0018695.1 helix-turn-helix domain-containing protein [Xenorhabdus nematophila]MCB4426683.1 helix-turn-helix domain-containing protein [Xenorhabdus nematophila]QNJ37695.1 helix-turn-helix domain-containing protein [Xenorhabdus nematophila]
MEEKMFADLLDSVNEMVAIENGEFEPKPEHVHRHAIPNVKSIRKNAGLKQIEFAEMVGVSVGLVRSWEQKCRIPSGAALKMLRLIEKKPYIIDTLRAI